MSRWKKLRESLNDFFKPCYVPEQSKFEQPSPSRESFSEDNQNLSQTKSKNDSTEEESSSDSPIKHSYFPDISSKEDLLGFKSYADTLASLIADPKTQTPLTIGIFGVWGSGKSTLMNMIQNELEQKNQIPEQHFVAIQFNAWKYSREDALHRAIILRVLDSLRPTEDNSLNQLSSRKSDSVDSLNKEIEKLEQRLYRDVEWEEKGKLTIDWPKFIRGGASSAFKLSYSFLPGLAGLTEAVKAAQGAFGKGEVANDAATLFEAFQRDVVKHHQVQLRHVEQFQDQFDNLISTHFPNKRIVIFVDDLDRCLPEKTIEVLEAIKLFMDVKRCVFILGLDQKLISRAIQYRYKDLQLEEKEKLAFDGIRYLEKIVQLPFMLPPLEVGDMRDYVESLNADWPETPSETSCAAILAEGLPPNPRQVKRTINVFLLLWKLAEHRRERVGDAVTPLRLVKVVVLQTAYPSLFEELKSNPLLLLQLEAYYLEPNTNQQEDVTSDDPQYSEDISSREVQPGTAKYDLKVIQDLLQRTGANESGLSCLFLYFYKHELARFSDLSENELRAFFSLAGRLPNEADLIPVSVETPRPVTVPNNIPRSGVVRFVGRNLELRKLHDLLQQTDRIAFTVIAGLGGIGKTELALQYCSAYQQNYPGGVCWLQAKEANIGMQIVNFAGAQLGLIPPQGVELLDQVAYCWRRWANGDVLVVFDDLFDYSVIQPYLPPAIPRFKVLITSRLQLGQSFKQLSINELNQESALELLKSLIGEKRLSQQLKDAEELCEWLGYLPLGLDLVGRYLARKPDLSLKEMQERLTSNGIEAQALTSPEIGMTAPQGIKAAFELSWQELGKQSRKLGEVLSLFALAPIPRQLVDQVASAQDPEILEDALIQLENLHLLEGDDPCQLHQLIREFFRTKLEESPQVDDRKRTFSGVMASVAQQIPQSPTRRIIEQLAPVIPHLGAVATQLIAWVDDENLIWIFVGLARFYEGQGALSQAEPWYEQCLSVCQDRLGSEHLYVASSLNNLAGLYRSQGRYQEAEPLYLQALEISKRVLGEEHPDVAQNLNNLALLYDAQGRYSEAEPLYQKSLDIRERQLGADHPDVAQSLNNLAALYYAQGRYSEAEPLYQKSLDIRERQLGVDHPDVALSLNNLAELYRAEGRYSEAEPLYQRSLGIRERQLGADHPDVAQSLNNLAAFYDALGRYQNAEPFYQRSLDIYERQLGADHPNVAQSLNNLAALYYAQGRYPEAEPLYQRSLDIYERQLGADHPDVAGSLNNLAALYYAQGHYPKAEPLYQRSLDIYERQLGADHPDVAGSLNNLAGLYYAQGRYPEAEPLYQRSLTIREHQLGADHPDVAQSLNSLAGLYRAQGRYAEAEPLYIKALQLRRRLLGEEHPNVGTSLNNLALLYDDQSRYQDSEPLYKQSLELRKRQLGDQHPAVAASLNNLASSYAAQGRKEEAKPLYEQALKIVEDQLGINHPTTVAMRENLEAL